MIISIDIIANSSKIYSTFDVYKAVGPVASKSESTKAGTIEEGSPVLQVDGFEPNRVHSIGIVANGEQQSGDILIEHTLTTSAALDGNMFYLCELHLVNCVIPCFINRFYSFRISHWIFSIQGVARRCNF